jgi:hypothetical protein
MGDGGRWFETAAQKAVRAQALGSIPDQDRTALRADS